MKAVSAVWVSGVGSPEQPNKASAPMWVSDAGSSSARTPVQPTKAQLPTRVTPSGSPSASRRTSHGLRRDQGRDLAHQVAVQPAPPAPSFAQAPPHGQRES